MSDWLTKLVAALELETVNDDLLSYVDDILNWGAVRSQSEPYIKLYEELGEQIINERFEELLDRLLVGDCALGQMFPLSLNEEQAKKRYRKLIRIFHPDRGFKSQVWLNYRAERVNKAYQQFLDNEEVQADISLDDFPEEPLSKKSDNGVKTKVGKFAIKPKFRYRSSIWRERLGSPQEFQKKIVSLLLVVSLFLIFAVYFSNKEAETSQALVSSPRASTLHSVQDQSLEEEYIVDSNAKKILQEANAFFSENEKVKVDTQFDSEVSSESELPLNGSVVQLGSFINELNEVTFNLEEHKVESDTCHSYVDLSFTSVINNGENKIKKLLSALSMYSGPSADCVLLEKLTKGTEVYMHAQTKDLMWAKVIIADADRELVGWIDMSKFDTPDSVTKKDKKVNADIGQSVNKPVTRVASSLTKSSRVKKEEGVVSKGGLPLSQPVYRQTQSQQGRESRPAYLSLIENMKTYYESGDSRKMSELYIASGRENKIRSSERIRKYYRKAFTRTINRSFKYVVESYRLEEQSTALVKGKMYLSMEMKKSGDVNYINASFTIVMIKLGGGFKIASFEWSRA